MAQRRLHGLQRVLGVNALFSTAYGNVGSSIYYALGLVAALALGFTPLVFVLAGALVASGTTGGSAAVPGKKGDVFTIAYADEAGNWGLPVQFPPVR